MRRRSIFHLTDSPGNAGSLYHAVWYEAGPPPSAQRQASPPGSHTYAGLLKTDVFLNPSPVHSC